VGTLQSKPSAKIDPALVEAVRTLKKDPALAERRLREIWNERPQEPNAAVYLARALRAQLKAQEAVKILEQLRSTHPNFAAASYELGLAFSDLREVSQALAAFRQAAAIDPNFPNVWLVLADLLHTSGDRKGADEAYLQHAERAAPVAHIRTAMSAIYEERFKDAVAILEKHLAAQPTDVATLAVLAEAKARLGQFEDAAEIFAKCLERSPGFGVARLNYATVLYSLQRIDECLAQTEILLARNPHERRTRSLHATALTHAGQSSEAIEHFESLLEEYPDDFKSWSAYGHALRSVGKRDDAVTAYRHSIKIAPQYGEAYWGIANLKTVRLEQSDIDALEAALARSDISHDDRVHCHFALGKAYEDASNFEDSFAQYAKGNALKSERMPYDPAYLETRAREWKAVFTRESFEASKGVGADAPDPIFIVGLPRSGSTLVEQILASHSMIEGTGELAEIRALARRFDGTKVGRQYPRTLLDFPKGSYRQLGEDYISATRRERRTAKPFFTDKMPSNFEHIGFIHLILPNAKIIDCRRHPMACGLSNFKQLYAHGQSFSYDLEMLGRHYAAYVELMSHFDSVLPGRVLHVNHEDIVANPEREIRRMLDYCSVPFEDACMNFHKTERIVRTVSSEQVRQRIFSDGVEQWRKFEPWLGSLRKALAAIPDAIPERSKRE
jgi:cytochrome c-type biogenesis protein CcmH/NrfG